MNERSREQIVEQKKREVLKESAEKEDQDDSSAVPIADFPLLVGVYYGISDVDQEYEVERRYTWKRLLTESELAKYASVHIEQMYIRGEDKTEDRHSFRLRRTWKEDESQRRLSVEHKRRGGETTGRLEYKREFSENDPMHSGMREEFERLWEHPRWESFRKTRYYIPWQLPNGNMCEIHYDVHEGGRLDGFVRIEVEFKNDADEVYVHGYHGYQDVLPEWVGADVTEDKRYGSKSLAKNGIPKDGENT